MFDKILVPLDGSLQSQAALEVASNLARLNGAEDVLVRAPGLPQEADVSPLTAVSPAAYSRERGRCERYLKRMASGEYASGLKVVCHVVDACEDPAANLLWAIRAYQADLVVMTSHCREGVRRVLRGSVAEKLIRQAPCPVLVVGKRSRLLQGYIHRPLAV